jgi:probable phosphoglycerate mutase
MIYLIRHGQTEFNREGRFQGQLDSPLTDLGQDQARRVGQALRPLVGPDWRLMTSPLGRARRTAEIIGEVAGLGVPEVDPRLAEISLGSWDGLTPEEIASASPDVRIETSRALWFASPDGEGYEPLKARVGAWLAETKASGRPTVAVSHGVTGWMIRGLWLGLDRDRALRLPSPPQDAIFRLSDGLCERIDVEPAGLALGEPER